MVMFYDRILLVVSMCQYYQKEQISITVFRLWPKSLPNNVFQIRVFVTLCLAPECGTLGPTRTLRVKYFRCLQGICDEAKRTLVEQHRLTNKLNLIHE